MSVKQLPESTARLITTSQVITSVSSVVKELFENSIDAGATNIEVILDNNGLDRIEIRDDGRGINATDTKFMCLSGYTSKISSFEDISSLTSYGFRGEALASLCHIADITITTRTVEDKYAMTYIIDKLGEIKSSKPSHHGIGTQVTVVNLFKNLPVRRQYISNSKTANLDAKRAEHVVKSLAIIQPGIRVTFVNNKMHLCSKPVEATLKKSAIQVLGYRIISKCEELAYNAEDVQLHMLVPNKNCSDLGELCQNSTDYIFIYFNKRAVIHKRIQKEITKSVSGYFGDKFPARKHPTSIVSITVPPNVMDINLEPNKTKILCKIEDVVLNLVQKVLSDYYEIIEAPVPEAKDDKAPVKRTKSKVEGQTVDESVAKRSRVLSSEGQSIPLDNMGNPAISHMKNSLNSLHDQKTQNSFNLPMQSNISMLEQQRADPYKEFINGIAVINFSTPITSEEQTSSGNSIISNTENNQTEEYDHVSKPGIAEQYTEIKDNLNINSEIIIQDSTSSLAENFSIRENINLLPNKEGNFNKPLTVEQHAGNTALLNQSAIISELNSNKSAADNFPLLLSDESEVFLNIDLNPSSLENITNSNHQVENHVTIRSNINNNSINIDNITREEWSKGLVKNSKGEFIQGPVVLLAGPPKNKKSEFQNLSYHSVSSQMGCKEQNGFTKFSRIRRPKIIAENPGIAFTRVAGLLAEEWKKLSHSERLKYESDENKCEVIGSKQNSVSSLNNKNMNNSSVVDLLKSPNCSKVKKVDLHQSCGTIDYSVDEIKEEMNYFTNFYKRVNCIHDKISLIGQLRPSGVWLYKKGSEIGVLKQWALQETVLFHRMMSEQTVPLIALEEKIRVKPKALGEELWQILTSLQQSFDPFINKIVISSPCITKNGFKIEIIEGPVDDSIFITHVASVCRFYGVNELWDLLNILKEKGLECTLYQSRPVKIINYFKSESVHKCRETPVAMELHVLVDIMNYWQEKMRTVNPKCLHDKLIFEPFYQ